VSGFPDRDVPGLCGREVGLEYGANGLLYVGEAMDLIELGAKNITNREAT